MRLFLNRGPIDSFPATPIRFEQIKPGRFLHSDAQACGLLRVEKISIYGWVKAKILRPQFKSELACRFNLVEVLPHDDHFQVEWDVSISQKLNTALESTERTQHS